jgi:nucleotide-binding universal stress UspA family protein
MKYEILLATDGTEYAGKAEIAAIKIAQSYSINIAAIYVAVARKDSEREEFVARGEEVLEEVIDLGAGMGVEVHKLLVGVSMQRMPRMGGRAETIAQVILDAAQKYHVHTIVLGSRGENEINPELGSVAQAVVRRARCTVLVAR